jgi:hypothetical protein
MRARTMLVGMAVAAVLGVGGVTSPAFGAMTCVNGGGKTPQGNCNGEGLGVQNPAGQLPPGQQP